MTNQIFDRRTIAIPGPAADASPELIAAAERRANEAVASSIKAANIPALVEEATGDALAATVAAVEAVRGDISAVVVRDRAGRPRTGVFFHGARNLLAARSDMKVDVLEFQGVAERDGVAVFGRNDRVIPSPTLTRPASNSHVALIYWKPSAGGGRPEVGVVYGAPAVVPSTPVLTVQSAVELGQVVIPADANSTTSSGVAITSSADFTSLVGGAVAFRTVADMRAWTTGVDGQRATVLSATGTGATEFVWSAGTAGWVQSGAVLARTGTARDAFWGVPSTEAARLALQGCLTYRADVGWTERYFAVYNATSNPQGMSTAGWYRVDGPQRGRTQGVLAGVAPPPGTPLIEYTGSTTVTTNASGDTSLVLPAAFPNGLISVHLDRLNFANYGQTTHIFSATQALDRINFRVFAPAAAAPVANASGIPYIYTAKGW